MLIGFYAYLSVLQLVFCNVQPVVGVKKSMIRYDNIINLMEDICMTVGEKLLKLRKEHDLTQEQFAELLKVSRHGPVIIGLN